MSKAEDLLNSLSEDDIALYSDDPVVEPHIVVNTDKTVTVPEALRHIAVEDEHNVKTVTFDCPRYWDGRDLYAMIMRIVYQRPDGHREPCPVENLRIDETDANTIHFDWTISNNVTPVKGKISFTVCAKRSDVDGNLENEWHTRLNQDLVVDEGLDCSNTEIKEQNPDIIEAMLVRLDRLEKYGGGNGSGSGLPTIDKSNEGMFLKVENGLPVWAPMTIPEQYGLISYDQDKTITIT